ncbi:DUF3486 family protein [Geobacter sp.]|uniref:DUF3486 family protein n=1 Tax=Geobacter sp. TaxID=46610 RepID=UPI00261ED31B|nr:DUF3486 family protein [Geobacter sp.]
MAQASSIERLPADIKSRLQELLQDPRVTQLDVTARINELLEAEGHPDRISKSAVNRYAIKMAEVGEKLRQSRDVASMFIARVGAAPQGQMGLLINEILRTLAFDISLKIQDADLKEPETLAATIDQVKALALAVQRLEQSATINVKRENEIRKAALEQAAEAVEKTAKQAGVSAEAIQMIRRDVLMMAV